MDYKKLIHDESAFLRETLEARMQDYGFKNMGRMELFLFAGTEAEINEVLNQIEAAIGDGSGLLHFRKHVPKKPKTTLPLFTYYTDIPSVLTADERNVRDNDTQSQELKVEFITQGEKRECSVVSGEDIFAVHSTKKYQVLIMFSWMSKSSLEASAWRSLRAFPAAARCRSFTWMTA